MSKRKILSLALALSIVAIMAVGATLAYFTDTDEATNTFTVGEVDITLIESQYYPQVDTDKTLEDVKADSATYQSDYLAVAGKDMVPGRWVRKAPYVTNDGVTDAYVRITAKMSKFMWDTTSLMENTTELNKGTITRTIVEPTEADPFAYVTYTYTAPIAAGKMTEFAPFWQVKIKDDIDNEDLENWGTQNIVVTAEAIQAEGFADAAAAFAAFEAEKE